MDKFEINGIDVRDMSILSRVFWIFASPFYILAVLIWSFAIAIGVFFLGLAMVVFAPFYILYTIFEDMFS